MLWLMRVRKPVHTYLRKGPCGYGHATCFNRVEWIGDPAGIRPGEHIISHEPLFWPGDWISLSVPSEKNVPRTFLTSSKKGFPPAPIMQCW